jgi:hypothetical protein
MAYYNCVMADGGPVTTPVNDTFQSKHTDCRAHSSVVSRITPEIVTNIGIVTSRILSIRYLIRWQAVPHLTKHVSYNLLLLVDEASEMKLIYALLAFVPAFSCFLAGE